MIFLIVWTLVLIFIANQFPLWDPLFWIVTWFIPPLVLLPILGWGT